MPRCWNMLESGGSLTVTWGEAWAAKGGVDIQTGPGTMEGKCRGPWRLPLEDGISACCGCSYRRQVRVLGTMAGTTRGYLLGSCLGQVPGSCRFSIHRPSPFCPVTHVCLILFCHGTALSSLPCSNQVLTWHSPVYVVAVLQRSSSTWDFAVNSRPPPGPLDPSHRHRPRPPLLLLLPHDARLGQAQQTPRGDTTRNCTRTRTRYHEYYDSCYSLCVRPTSVTVAAHGTPCPDQPSSQSARPILPRTTGLGV